MKTVISQVAHLPQLKSVVKHSSHSDKDLYPNEEASFSKKSTDIARVNRHHVVTSTALAPNSSKKLMRRFLTSCLIVADLAIIPVFAQAASASDYVDVPSNYIYDTSGRSGPVARHDYCTSSPDEFPAVGENANFRGPCARHDLCYDSPTDKKLCDVRLREDMRTNCKAAYSFVNPNRRLCYRTADAYLAAVVAAS